MHQKDLIFLHDFREFGCLNHLVAAIAFYQAGVYATDTGSEAYRLLEGLETQQAAKQALELNVGARVQSIVSSRLFSEYVSAIEDLGALLFSVRHREQSGIFQRYLKSSVGEVGAFFNDVLKHGWGDLSNMLKLPSLEGLGETMDPDTFRQVSGEYKAYPQIIREIAGSYRKTVGIEQADFGGVNGLPADWQDNIYIALEMVELGSDESKRKPLLTEAFNKIKHRFTVVERIDEFLEAEPNGNSLRCAYHSRKPDWPEKLLISIAGIASYSVAIVLLLMTLQNSGIEV